MNNVDDTCEEKQRMENNCIVEGKAILKTWVGPMFTKHERLISVEEVVCFTPRSF